MITQTLDLNLIPGRVLPMVNVSQYDKDSRTLEFTIYNGDTSFDLTGLSAYIQGLKPDGHGFNYSATVSSGKITADVTEQMTAVSGRVMCEVIIMSGTDRIGTGNFILNVEAAAMPDGSNMSDSDYSYIEQLIEDAQEAVTDAEAWAVGERGGVPVDPSDPTYENSAHYWAQQASGAVNDMTGATASTPGAHGLVPAPSAGDQDKVLMGDGTWKAPSGGSDMTGATAGSAGTHGLVPAPAAGDQAKFLQGDGTWATPSGGSDMTGATALTPGVHGLVPAPGAGDQDKVLKGDGTWAAVAGASDMTGATAGSSGSHGLVPAPSAGDQDKVLKGDATWGDLPGDMTGASVGNPGVHGLVPAPAAGDQDKVLKGDGTWGTVSADYTPLTYAQFQQLTPLEQESGKYIVTDMNPYSNAYNIAYDASYSVGQKIDALNADIIIVTHTETTARSVAANSVTEYTVTSDIPNGYRPISVVVRRHGTDVATLFGCIIDSSGTSTPVWRVQVWNFHTGSASLKPKFDIICKKE